MVQASPSAIFAAIFYFSRPADNQALTQPSLTAPLTSGQETYWVAPTAENL
jgi:hypothetical protein